MLQERNPIRTMQASIRMPATLLLLAGLAQGGRAQRPGTPGAQKV